MARKRLTEIFPFLLPLREAQKKSIFYFKMKLDNKCYAMNLTKEKFPYLLYDANTELVNNNTGFDMEYEYNKIYNIKLAAKTINHIVIKPGETFSFWQLVKNADNQEKYKDALLVRNGKLIATYGGGLCQLSNILYWTFLHTPLTVVERHGHSVKTFETNDLDGTDAAVSEGWLDLKVTNNTSSMYKINLRFENTTLYASIYTNNLHLYSYEILNHDSQFFKIGNKLYQRVSVYQRKYDSEMTKVYEKKLYEDTYEIGYPVYENISIGNPIKVQ